MAELYSTAWWMGVKTTYYLHMMPRHTAEQSTVKVNKAAQPSAAGFGARRGFGAARTAPLPVVDEVDGQQCPIDPMERLQCDSCQ